MNCRTRKEKIGDFLATVKKIFVTTLLVAWACLTLALGFSLGMEKRDNESLRNQIRVMENQREEKKDSSEARYIILDW